MQGAGVSARKQTMPETISQSLPVTQLAIDGGAPVSSAFIPVVSARLGEEEIAAVTAVMRSGQLRAGAKCLEFERRFAEASDAAFALSCGNGTIALQLAYEVLFDRGDEVLCPAWTYFATIGMVIARGAKPVFCEVDPETFNLNATDAATRITPRTRAIVATHLYGNPADIEAIDHLAARNGLKVIYDAAQAHMARFGGKGIGAYGDATTYSFYPTKNMTTGEGGMVTVNDASLASQLNILRDQGQSPTERYLHVDVGYNYRLNDIAAAIGLSQFAKLPGRTARRQRNAELLTELLSGVAEVKAPRSSPGAEHVYHQYTVRLDLSRLKCTRDQFAAALKAEGIGSAVHYPRAATQQPAIAKHCGQVGAYPISESLALEVLCLPIHHELTDEMIRLIGEAVAKVAAAYRR